MVSSLQTYSSIPVYSCNPEKMIVDHETLEQQVLGKEFQPIRDATDTTYRVGVYFLAFMMRPQPKEIEHLLEKAHLDKIPTAVVTVQLWKNLTTDPESRHSGLQLEKENHRYFHILVNYGGMNDCRWNDEEVTNIRTFLKSQNQGESSSNSSNSSSYSSSYSSSSSSSLSSIYSSSSNSSLSSS